jgi:hypothetical protein
MDGSMNLEQALEERLRIINCTPADIKRFITAHPPSSRMVPVREGLHLEGKQCCWLEFGCVLKVLRQTSSRLADSSQHAHPAAGSGAGELCC